MNYNGGHYFRSRLPALPPISTRTLHHPSFLPLYMAADFAHHHTDCYNQTVLPIIPAEFFYSDPTTSCGGRIPNIVSELMVFDYFQLNTPPPVMSACLAPPARPDPFRSASHPTRDLGSLTCKINPLQSSAPPSCVILQLTQEEDEAITNLLKLHHQEPKQSDETPVSPQMDLNPIPLDSTSTEEARKPPCDVVQHQMEDSQLQQGGCWSNRELEAADTLLSRFSVMENDKIWDQNHNKSAATLHDLLLHQLQDSEAFPASVTTDCFQKDTGFSFSHVSESGEPDREDFVFEKSKNADNVHWVPSLSSSSSSVSGGFSEERMLSNSEGDAVSGLLSLGGVEVLDIDK